METSHKQRMFELQQLLQLLQQHGVRSYSDGTLTLQLAPAEPAQVQSQPVQQMQRMSDELRAAMSKLDPMYSDDALFAFGEQ